MSQNKMYLKCKYSGRAIELATQLTEFEMWTSFVTREDLSAFFIRNPCLTDGEEQWDFELVFERQPVSPEELKHKQNVPVGYPYNVSGSSLRVEEAGEENE